MSIKHQKTFFKCLLLALFGGLLWLAACQPAASDPASAPLEPITVKLHWRHSVQYLGLYAAQEHSYYAAEGLSVTLVPLSDTDEQGQALAQVAAGDYDFGAGASAVSVESANAQVVAIATIYQQSPMAFFARAGSGIVTPADLAGRPIAVKSATWQLLLADLLQREGLTLDDIQPIPAGFDMTPFYEEKVQVWSGYITDEVVRARQQGLDLVTLPLYEYGVGSYANMIFTGQHMLETNPELVERFLRASLLGWEWAINHPAEAVDLMLTRFPELKPERDFHLNSFQASIPLIRPTGLPIGYLDCPMWLQELTSVDSAVQENYCNNRILETIIHTRVALSDQ